jgi:aspartyl-tRNA(Asn)/glutamyl-tRNA(Gln) amidotransferase subunit A
MTDTASLRKLNEKYSMFSYIADNVPAQASKFQFSAADSLTSKGIVTRGGSGILDGYRPVFDAAAIEKMKAYGGKLIGKSNLDEFGFGSFCTTSPFGTPKNPFDPKRSCGGSSGGSACAAAVIDGHISLGVSTVGSICCPASFCGVYGLVPTYGRVSRHGVIDSGGSVDTVGLLSSDPKKFSEFLPVISGADKRDPTSCVQPALDLKGKKIRTVAVPVDALSGVSGDVLSAFESSLDRLGSMGVEVNRIEMPSLVYALPAIRVLAAAEASTFLASFVGMRYGQQDGDLTLKFDDYFTSIRSEYFGEEAKRTIMLGTYVRMAGPRDRYYIKSLKARTALISLYKAIFAEGNDAVLTPTMPFVSPKFEEISKMTPAQTYKAGYLTAPPGLTGMPHISVPCGYNKEGMPIGMQMVTDHWKEDPLITFAKEWSSVFEAKRPEVSL